jgi:glycosyltransferase involved in cell wall biosynthesis
MKNISVIIPTYNFVEITSRVINAVLNQTYSPKEIIIIDSSEDEKILKLVDSLKSSIPIRYHRFNKLYPGEARNKGVDFSLYEYIAFIDSKTVPSSDWLQINTKNLVERNAQVIFGSTQYIASSDFQQCVKACTYGNFPLETTPGTLIQKTHFKELGGFQENVRTGDDLAWRLRIKSSALSWINPPDATLSYSELESSLLNTLKRFFTYQLSAAKLDIQNTPRNIIFAITIIFLSIMILQWNAIVGWEDSFLYIPNITKIYTLLVFVTTLMVLLINRNFFKNTFGPFVSGSLNLVLFITFLAAAFYWNAGIANWAEGSELYIPHITKIYLFSILVLSYIYRGLYFPLSHGFAREKLFPFWWLKVGLIGLILDLAKAPGFISGAILKIWNKK